MNWLINKKSKLICYYAAFGFLINMLSGNLALCTNKNYYIRFTPGLQRAYFEIQKLRIQPARSLIEEERSANTENGFVPYLENYADLHYLLISEDKIAFKNLLEKEDVRLDSLGKLPDSSPYKRFFQAEVRLHWAFAKIKFGNEISGCWDVIKAYRLLEENRKKFPSFLPTLKSLGFLHVLIGSVPENYTWVTRILGLKGNIKLGVQEIISVAQSETIFQQEAQLIDLLIHAYTLELSDNQKERVRELPKQQPDNLLLHFFATTILMKEGNSLDASWYLYHAPAGKDYLPFPFLSYLKGEVALQQGRYDEAFNWYSAFQRSYKGFNYLKDSNLKMFMCKWLSGRDQEAGIYMARISQSGSEIIEADKLASKTAADYTTGKLTQQQKVLYKARYASDGGFLEAASAVLDPFSEKSFSAIIDKSEFNYRKGRIAQKSGLVNESVSFFERTILITKGQSTGIGASSALQLGYIYKDKKQYQKAILYFKAAMSYKKYEYKDSIDNKAKAAITQIEQHM